MDEAGATQMLQKRLINPALVEINGSVLATLLQKLTYLPLAIVQTAAYVNETGISLSEYEQLLSDQEDDVIELLSEESGDDGRYDDIKNPVATTWLISFEQIRLHSPFAADYLSFMACVNPMDIPQLLLSQGLSQRQKTDAIGTLNAYSFLKKHSDGKPFDIHRLVHIATRGWLKIKEELPVWQSEAVKRLGELLANSDETNRTTWRTYISHAQFAAVNHNKADDEMIYLARKCGECLNNV